MKTKYDPAELEVIEFEACDIVTSSVGDTADEYDGTFGGGYDAGGWT